MHLVAHWISNFLSPAKGSLPERDVKMPSIQRSVACIAVALALGSAAGTADAVVYSSSFDPPNFEGTATFDVSPGCLNAGNGYQVNGSPGCTISWLSATVTFNDPLAPTTFSYVPGFLPSAIDVNRIWVLGGELSGVDSTAIGAMVLSGQANTTFNGPWWIQFAFDPSPTSLQNGAFGLGIVNLFTGTCSEDQSQRVCSRNPDPSSVAQVENFTRVVQEPETLGLALAALAAAFIARRRKEPKT